MLKSVLGLFFLVIIGSISHSLIWVLLLDNCNSNDNKKIICIYVENPPEERGKTQGSKVLKTSK